MGPIAFSLCQKPVLGLMMYLASACVFPRLFDSEPLPLQQANARLIKEFNAPVGTSYFLELDFNFAAVSVIRSDVVVGSHPYNDCERDYADIPQSRRAEIGPPMPIHVLVTEKKTGIVRIDRVFNVQCQVSWGFWSVTRTAARLDLAAGSYVIDVRNMAAQAGLDKVKTTVSLGPGRMK